MNDVVEAAPAVADGSSDGAPGFGRRLAAERERLGLSIDDIAARLRLNPKQVQAIESESLPPLPPPFLRGFVRNYAKELKLDPAPLLDELNARLAPPEERLEQESRAAAGGLGALGEHAPRRLVIVGVIAALVVFAVIGWLASRTQPSPEPAAQVPQATPPQPTPVAVVPPRSTAADASAAPAPAEATAMETTTPPANASVAAAVPTKTEPLRMTFREQAWVEVTQADGRIVHSQINEAGTEQRIGGKAPLRLVVGNASAVSVEYKGAPVDLKPVTSVDNVARITLN